MQYALEILSNSSLNLKFSFRLTDYLIINNNKISIIFMHHTDFPYSKSLI